MAYFRFLVGFCLFSIVFVTLFVTPLAAIQGTAQETDQATAALNADALFQSDHLVKVEIEVDPDDWKKICSQSRSFADALKKDASSESPFDYVKANVTIDGVLINDVGIRKKGFIGSLDGTRPSLKIKFNEYNKSQNPIDGLSRLTLNNNKQDPGRISQYMSYKLFRESGTVAPRCNFAKVTVNGINLGIYSNVESVRKEFLANGFGKSGGALFEGTVTDFYPSWVKKFEKKNKKAKFKHIRKLAELLEKEGVTVAEIDERVDVDAFLKFWATESLIGFWDGYCQNQNNYFVYRHPENDKFYFVPWGTDSSFAKASPLPPYRIRPRSVHSRAILPYRLYQFPEIKERYQEVMMGLLEEHWNEEDLIAEIDRLEAFLKDHVMESNKGFSRSLKTYRSFVKTRRKNIVEEFADGPPVLEHVAGAPIYFAEVGNAKVTFSTEWFDKTPKDPTKEGEIELELTIDGEVVEMRDVGVIAELSKWPSQDAETPASIVIIGYRVSDGEKITLGTGLPASDFNPSENAPASIGGIYMVGNRFVDENGKMQMLGGTVTFEEASMEKGAVVKGTMELTITKMKGGAER